MKYRIFLIFRYIFFQILVHKYKVRLILACVLHSNVSAWAVSIFVTQHRYYYIFPKSNIEIYQIKVCQIRRRLRIEEIRKMYLKND